MDAKRELVQKLHLEGKTTSEIVKSLQNLKINRRFVQRTVARFKATGSVEITHNGGPKCSITTPSLVKVVRERIRRNCAVSARKMAKELNVSRKTVRNVIKNKLKMRAYKKKQIHGLTERQKKMRQERSVLILKRHAGCNIVFSDEKFFLLQKNHNSQNDRVYAANMADIPKDKRAVERFQNVSSVMVWGAVSSKGKLPLLFIEKGVKINAQYYLDNVLVNHLLPHASTLFGDEPYCFQQDSAPAHKAKIVQNWLKDNMPCFIPVNEWPPSSPDLNPLDFSIWGYMLSKLTNIKNMKLDQFKRLLMKIWDEIPDELVRAACKSFEKRLKLVKKAKGERFEIDC